jgi:hypothetical protein
MRPVFETAAHLKIDDFLQYNRRIFCLSLLSRILTPAPGTKWTPKSFSVEKQYKEQKNLITYKLHLWQTKESLMSQSLHS